MVTASSVFGFVVLLAQVLLMLPYQHQPIEIIQMQYDHNHMVGSVDENMSERKVEHHLHGNSRSKSYQIEDF